MAGEIFVITCYSLAIILSIGSIVISIRSSRKAKESLERIEESRKTTEAAYERIQEMKNRG